MSDDDRADRLRQRRNKAKERAGKDESELSKPSETDKQAETSKQSGSSKSSEPDKTDETGERDEQSVKEDNEGLYMYIPGAQKAEVGHVYNACKAAYEREFDREFEKNRDYYPLVIEFGLEQIDDADAEELDELLNELDY
jgi:hypothetical protein